MMLFNRLVAGALSLVPKPIVRATAKRYIAGETMGEALEAAAEMNRQGFTTTIDLLGENAADAAHARRAAAEYKEILRAIETRGIDGNISVKPTLFGLNIDSGLCLELFGELAEAARPLGSFVRVEMENSAWTEDTLALYRRLREDSENVGIVVQAYLRRSLADVQGLADFGPNVRLVKGVYIERYAIAYQDPEIIRRNYVHLAEILIRQGAYVAFATHDERLVWEALRMIDSFGLPDSAYEFQMLLGVGERLRRILRDAGHRLRVYIPYGADWLPYSTRRLRENPRIAGYVLKSMLRRE